MTDRIKGPAKLVLGTAQLGTNYGVTNQHGKPDEEAAKQLLQTAIKMGVTTLDTARAYGDSERVIGRFLRSVSEHNPFTVVTKTDPALTASGQPVDVQKATIASLDASRAALGLHSLPCVLLHRPEHITDAGGAAMRALIEQMECGLIGQIGVSVSEPGELLQALEVPEITHVQFPFNLLDHRFENALIQQKLRQRPDVTVHVRSVFLQGLIVAGTDELMRKHFGDDGQQVFEFLDTLPGTLGMPDRLTAAIGYVRCMDWIDGIVIGTASSRELTDISAAFAMDVNHDILQKVRKSRPEIDAKILNPAMWPKDMS